MKQEEEPQKRHDCCTTSVPTYEASIYIGRMEGYSSRAWPEWKIHELLRRHCDGGECVTLTETTFFYRGGSEPGYHIGFINYPRFPRSDEEICASAMALAKTLRRELGQTRVTIVTPKHTVMLGPVDRGPTQETEDDDEK